MAEIINNVNITCRAISSKLGKDIKILDITGLSPIADYFIVASGSNPNQLHAMCDEVVDKLGKEGLNALRTEGYNTANWILLDYGDFMVHLFTSEAREFYNLEKIWKDAKISEFKD